MATTHDVMTTGKLAYSWEQYRWIVGVAALAVAFGAVSWSASSINDRKAAAVCAERYHAAHSAQDTATVDEYWPSRGNTRVRNNAVTLRCGALRAAGRIPL